VSHKISALKLELNQNPLPSVIFWIDASFRFTVWKGAMHCFHKEAQLLAYHSEQIHDSLFIDGGVSQTTKVYGFTVNRPSNWRRLYRQGGS